jgi:hypothetical protein
MKSRLKAALRRRAAEQPHLCNGGTASMAHSSPLVDTTLKLSCKHVQTRSIKLGAKKTHCRENQTSLLRKIEKL